jgi:hypothetical protein
MLFARRAHRSLNVLLHPVVIFVPVRSAFFSGVALPMKLPPADSNKMACPAKFPCSRRACSALSGGSRQPLDRHNSHTTGNSCGWQAISTRRVSIPAHNSTPNAGNATPYRVAFHNLALSLASQIIVDGDNLAIPSAGLPGRFASVEGRYVGGCSCRVSALLWAGQNSTSAVHHWRLPSSNYGSNQVSLLYQ